MANKLPLYTNVQFSFRSFADSVCSALLMCLFALQCRYYIPMYVQVLEILRPTKRIYLTL